MKIELSCYKCGHIRETNLIGGSLSDGAKYSILPECPNCMATKLIGPKWPAVGELYTIQQGDSLGVIAQRAYGDGFKYAAIQEANKKILRDKNPNLIHPGEIIYIPPAPADKTKEDPKPNALIECRSFKWHSEKTMESGYFLSRRKNGKIAITTTLGCKYPNRLKFDQWRYPGETEWRD